MSLAFLAKKSWHTANLRNVEKVWLAEQKHAQEEKKLAELKKNIEEERQLQELRKLQASQGKKSSAAERVDWMYEGPMAQNSKTTEDYLLGKEYAPRETESNLKNLAADSSSYGALMHEKSSFSASDAFARLNEDPMMVIRKQQQAAQETILKNPVKMGRIREQVEKMLRKERKSTFKKRKHRKDKSVISDRESEEDIRQERKKRKHHSASRGIHSRSRSRSTYRKRLHKRTEAHDGARRRHTDSDPGSSPHSSRCDRNHGSKHRHHRNFRASDDESGEEYARGGSRHNERRRSSRVSDNDLKQSRRDPYRRHREYHDRSLSTSRRYSRSNKRSRTPERNRSHASAGTRYGLSKPSGAIESHNVDKTSLGPNTKFLEKVRDARRHEESERQKRLQKKPLSHLTADEKQRLAAQMVADAQHREHYLSERSNRKLDKFNDRESNCSVDEKAHFLRELHDAAYAAGEDATIEQRLRRNAHYIQKRAEATNFLHK